MSIREIGGLILIAAGAAITPLGWIISHRILVAAVALVAAGAALFYTARVLRREERLAKVASGGGDGAAVPGDIHNYSGWRSGGRTETMDSSSHTGESGD